MGRVDKAGELTCAAALALGGGAAVDRHARSVRIGNEHPMGAHAFPVRIAILLGGAGPCILLATAARPREREQDVAPRCIEVGRGVR